MMSQNHLLLLFVKHPKAGQTKTRLAAGIGHPRALAVYRALLQHLRQEAEATLADKAVFYGNEIPPQDLWAETAWPRLPQQGDDLGARMQQAFQWGFDQGYQRIVLVGSDIPHLTHHLLNDAFEQLGTHPAMLGPAADGGYYLIGLSQPCPRVFAGKTWSTSSVLPDTLADFEAEGLSYALGPTLNDVDTVADLAGTWLADWIPSDPTAGP
jgi:uncharacterized protein